MPEDRQPGPATQEPYVPSIANLSQLATLPFDELPDLLRRQAYDVQYAELEDSTGGQLWVTSHGWKHLEHLDPANWYLEGRYRKFGQLLSGGSGTVYRVPTTGPCHRRVDLVAKFSRVAQQVHLDVSSAFPGGVARAEVDCASFNDPFQEFGLLEELRTSQYGPRSLRILTKRPVAIYSPGRRFQPWQLGRSEDRFRRTTRQLEMDQRVHAAGCESVALAMERQYIALFHWVDGTDAEALVRQGLLSDDAAAVLVNDVISDLAAKGFRVLDTKPNHIILRRRRGGDLLRRRGRWVYALVDFELLQRTEQYERWRQQRAGVEGPGVGEFESRLIFAP